MRALRPLPFLLLTLPAAAQNQQPPIPPPGVQVPADEAPAANPGAAIPPADAPGGEPQPGVPLGENLIVEDIIEPKLSGNALAGLYRKYTGKRVIVTTAAAGAEFSFVQEASPEDPLTWAEAADLLRKAAVLENFVFVPDPQNPNWEILALATGGINPKGIGLGVFSEDDVLPEGDAVISYVMNLQYIKPEQAVQIFQQVIGQFGAFGSVAAVPNAASVIITENTSLIRRLIQLKEEIDKPSGLVTTRFIPVQYADVTELAATLNELLTSQQQSQRSAGLQRADGAPPAPAAPAVEGAPPVPAAPGQAGQSGGSASGEETPVQIIPDARTNRIFAMGRPVDVIFIEGLVRQFDTQSDQRNFLRRKLRFLPVTEFLPIAENALTRAFSGTGDPATTGGGAAAQGGRTGGRGGQQGGRGAGTNQFGGGGGQFGGGQFGGGGGGGFGGGGAGGAGGRGAVLSDPQTTTAVESVLVGRTLLVADNITNSIVVQGPPSGVEIIEKLLDEVDVRADQVMISTVFGQLALTDDTTTGVNWLRAFREFSGEEGGAAVGLLTGGVPPVNRLPDSMTSPIVDAANGLPGATGLNIYGRIGSSLGAYVNLLQENTNFTILSRPSIFTANNQRGTISSGRRIAIPTNSNQFTGGGVSTNIEYRDVVLRLEVIPLINSPEEITLTIALVNDEVVGQSENIEGIGSVPIIGTREILTTVTVPNNQTVVLGGLITTNQTESVTGVPILSSIPGLGRLFSTKSTGEDRSELMIFIQPSIISGDLSRDAVQVDMDSRYKVADDLHRMADGPGVLPPADVVVIPEKGEAPPAGATTRTTTRVVQPAPTRVPTQGGLRPIHRR